jgi:hypothetical protein
MAQRPSSPALLLALPLALLLGLLPYLPLLDGDTVPVNKDYSRFTLPQLLQVRAALLDGVVLQWNSAFYSGTPYTPVPNAAGLYPPLVLCLLLFGTVLGTAVANLAHLAFGAYGCVLLARRAGASGPLSALAAPVYLWGTSTRLLGWSLPMEAMGTAWIPWVLWCTVRALDAPARRTALGWAALGGLAHAAVAWSGGYITLLYGLLLLGVLAATLSLHRSAPLAAAGRAALVLAVTVAVSLGALAGRVLPIRNWTELTDRAEALTLENALDGRLTGMELFAVAQGEGWLLLGLAGLGLGLAALERRALGVALGLGAALLVVLATGLLTPFLHGYVPGFDQLRQPYRSLVLWPTMLAPLVALGASLGAQRFGAGGPRRRVAAGVLAALLVAGGVAESYAVHRGVYDEAARDPLPQSLSERLAGNAVLREVQRLRAEEGPYRVHAFEATRVLLKHTNTLVAVFLGLETMEGILGNIIVVPYDAEYLQPSRRAPARLWGMLAGRWVTSREPLDLEGLELLGEFPVDPGEYFPGLSGPYLYRNRHCLPRAFTTQSALLCVDPRPEAWSHLAAAPFWSPRHTVLLAAGAEPDPQLLAHFERGVTLEPGVVPAAVGQAGLQVATPEAFAAELRAVRSELRELPPPVAGWNRLELELPEGGAECWLVLAETCALYPGWTAKVDGAQVPLWRANGAATALRLPAGARHVELRYRTPGLVPGLAISSVTVALALLLYVFGRRGCRTGRSDLSAGAAAGVAG